MLYIDIHETLQGSLTAPYVAVPNLINIVTQPHYQNTSNTEAEALEDCLKKIALIAFEDIFPQKNTPDTPA